MKIIISLLEVSKQPQWPHVILKLQLYFSKSQATHDGMAFEFIQHVKIVKDIILLNYGLVFQLVFLQVCEMSWNAHSCKCFIFQSALQFFILWNVTCK